MQNIHEINENEKNYIYMTNVCQNMEIIRFLFTNIILNNM